MGLSGLVTAGMLALLPAGNALAVTWQVTTAQAVALPDSATDAWGLSANESGVSFAQHWDGVSWTAMQLPSTAQESAIAGGGPQDAWVVGSVAAPGYNRRQPFMTHYNGSSWTSYSLPDDGASERLSSVAMVSPSNVWAAGGNVLVHWNGANLSRVTPPAPVGASGNTGISSLSVGGGVLWGLVTATVGGSQVHYAARWDGSNWSFTTPLPTAPAGHWWQVGNVSANSPANVWVAITDNDQNFNTTAVTLHWDGSSWSTIPMPASGVEQTLSSIAAGNSDAWAVGTYTPSSSNQAPVAAVYHWNGSSWSAVPFPVTTAYSYASAVAYVPGTTTVWVSGSQSLSGNGGSYTDFTATG